VARKPHVKRVTPFWSLIAPPRWHSFLVAVIRDSNVLLAKKMGSADDSFEAALLLVIITLLAAAIIQIIWSS
jgi:hypothetical protein